MNTKEFKVVETSMTSHRVDNLTASMMHIIYLTAVNDNGESVPSETLMAWTDPAIEPWVEIPNVHPADRILEGILFPIAEHVLYTTEKQTLNYSNGNIHLSVYELISSLCVAM